VLFGLLREGADVAAREAVAALLWPMEGVRFHKPVAVGNYTDFYASMHHARNVGKLFRPEQPLLPNYGWVPIGYHGRASSLVVSGTAVRRPWGQCKLAGVDAPVFQPTAQLDYELEVGAYIGEGNGLGVPIGMAEAEWHLFGISLLNDWSARDIQAWEAQPLGPFLGKSFATSVSPWVVPMEALRPYRAPLAARAEGQPEPLPYLRESPLAMPSGIDVQLEVYLSTSKIRKELDAPACLSRANLCDLYWSFPQMVAHHTSNGCNLLVGDLLASGTVSGAEAGAQGCLLEITRRGAAAIQLANGETRTFLQDGDEVILRGFCERANLPRISLGECRGMIQPADMRPGSRSGENAV
jgi:fumarylacetoacetase